jgi:phosphoglycerate dehydrogenase-like enzyme
MLMLAAAKNILPMDHALRQSDWRPRYAPDTALLLTGKTALILGFGHIGRVLAKYLKAFDMKILATRNSVESREFEDNIDIYSSSALRDLLPVTDFLVIALPLTTATEGLIGQDELALLPPEAILVNIGRGAIIDQAALYNALKQRRIAGAGIDVWYNYPKDEDARAHTLPANHPFHELDNVVMSPHRAGGLNTDDTERLRMSHLAVLLNAAAFGEEMPNRVDREKGY